MFVRALSANWMAVALMGFMGSVVWFPNVRFICPMLTFRFVAIDISCVGGVPRIRISYIGRQKEI